MNDLDQSGIDYDLLGKYLSGEATPDEAIALEEWLFEPGNKRLFNKIEKIWNGLPGDTHHQLPDRMAAWRELQPYLRIKKLSPVARLFSSWYAVAASLIAITGIVLFFVLNKQPGGVIQDYITHGPSQKIIRDSLPDGSKIVLNRNSILRYSKSFNTAGRNVQLQGQSFFEVAPNKAKPFTVQVGNVTIKVIGTAFNVRQNGNGNLLEVQVQSGLVKMSTATKEIAVATGQTGMYDKTRDLLVIKDSIDVNSFSYATRQFEFNNLSVDQLIPYLEDAYGVTIVLRKKGILQYRVSGRFVDMPFENVMEALAMTIPFTYKKEGNTWYLDGNGYD